MKRIKLGILQTNHDKSRVVHSLGLTSAGNALERTEFDAVDAMAKQLPMMMLGRNLGVPDEDLGWLVEKGDALIGNSAPDFTQHVIDKVDTSDYAMMPFRRPHDCDVGRMPNRHLAFGQGGIHVCLGMHLAKLEVRIVIQELVKRVGVFEAIAPPTRTRSTFIRGEKKLNVRATRTSRK